MGEVYRARYTARPHCRNQEYFATLRRSAHKQRFEREARGISCLNNLNICALHDIGHQQGIGHLVMDVKGETLGKRLERESLLLDHVRKVGAQIADALDKAHRSGVVHRDLKPSVLSSRKRLDIVFVL